MQFMWIFLAVYFLIILGIGLVVHVLNAIGLVAIARHRGISSANLAWVPFFGIAYVTGAIADDQTSKEIGFDRRLRVWLLWMSLLLTVLTGVLIAQMFPIGSGYTASIIDPLFAITLLLTLIIGMPFTFFWYVAHHKLYKSCQPNNSTLFTVLSVLFGIAPFLVFAVRHYVDGQNMNRNW